MQLYHHTFPPQSHTHTRSYLFRDIDPFHHGHNSISRFMCSSEKIRETSSLSSGEKKQPSVDLSPFSTLLFLFWPVFFPIVSSFSPEGQRHTHLLLRWFTLLCAINAEFPAWLVFVVVVEQNCQIHLCFLFTS